MSIEFIFFLDVLTWTVVACVFLSSLTNSQSVVGLLALYTMALRSSCYDLNTVTFTVSEKSETLLTHLKKQMEQEKDHIACKFSFDLLEASSCHKKCSPSGFTLCYTMSSKFIQCRYFLRTKSSLEHLGLNWLNKNETIYHFINVLVYIYVIGRHWQ